MIAQRPGGDTAALRASGVGQWAYDPASDLLQVDDITAALLGFDAEPLGLPLDLAVRHVAGEDAGRLRATLTRACDEATAVVVEFRVRRPDGVESSTRLRGGAEPSSSGPGARLIGVAADITDLLGVHERAGRTLQEVSDGVLVLDRDWTVVYVNAAAGRQLGTDPAELVGSPLWHRFPAEVDGRLWVELHACALAGRAAVFEVDLAPATDRGATEVRCLPGDDGVTLYLRDLAGEHRFEREREQLIEHLERALARGRQLLALTRALGTAMSPSAVADAVTAQARRALGTEFAGIALVDEARIEIRYLSMDPLPPETASAWTAIPLSAPAPVADAARTARPVFFEDVEQTVARYPDIGPHLVTARAQAMAQLPLLSAGGTVLGTLTLTWRDPHPMNADDRDFLTTLAGHTAQALERALLFEQQRTASAVLQRAVLPEVLPEVPGWAMQARYLPATDGLDVGGDWYDAFLLPDGRLAVALGDATGHGLGAARVMSVLRNALRAYAMLGEGPAAVLQHLDALVQRLEPEAMATVTYLEFDPHTGIGVRAAAGHMPPLLSTADGGVALVTDGDVDPPLGCIGDLGVRERPIALGEADALMLFTDGLVERRDIDVVEGLQRLEQHAGAESDRRRAQQATGPPAGESRLGEALDAMIDAMLGDGAYGDDVCVLTLARRPTGTARRRVVRTLLAHPPAAREGRGIVRATLADWGLDELVDTACLVVSELVANAVLHAGSGIVLDLHPVDGGVRVAVHDPDERQPQPQPLDPDSERGRGMHLVDGVATRWGVDTTSYGKRVWAELHP
jgi:PAS domain-containing protein/anti-sigma regulatory factor (Ser/Thr protein kinase)